MSNDKKAPGFSTLSVHAGVEPDPSTGAIMTPVYMSSTYVQEGIGKHKGYEYSRSSNPTRDALESAFAALEGGQNGLAFSSGLAAVDAVLMTLSPGDEVIAGDDLYGGTRRLFTTHYAPLGIKFHFVDTQDASNVTAVLNERTRLVWLETPTNPLLRITDIGGGRQSPRRPPPPNWRWTTPLPHPPCNAHSNAERTSSCTALPSTSADTPTL